MASEVYAFQVTIPAGTALATPFRQLVTFPVRKVDTLEVTIPPGPAGNMGFAITMRGINVMPLVPNTWIVTDNERIRWDITDLPTSGDWQVSGYNTGTFDHTVYLRWLVGLTNTPGTVPLLGQTSFSALSSG